MGEKAFPPGSSPLAYLLSLASNLILIQMVSALDTEAQPHFGPSRKVLLSINFILTWPLDEGPLHNLWEPVQIENAEVFLKNYYDFNTAIAEH